MDSIMGSHNIMGPDYLSNISRSRTWTQLSLKTGTLISRGLKMSLSRKHATISFALYTW
jgi:hypothetical protein